jgi:hypothetical protein
MPPPTVVIPPWIASIDPTAPVDRMLAGYRTGLSAGEAQSAAAARAQQMMLAQQQAAELNAYRQQQQALDAAQFNATLRLQQEKAQREAQLAASQLEGQRGVQEDLAAGLQWPQVLAKWAPKLFAGEPRGLAQAMEQVAGPRPPVFGETPEGVPYIQGPGGGVSVVPRAYTRGEHIPRTQQFDGVPYIETSPGQWAPLRQPQEQALTQAGRAKLQELNRDEARIFRTWGDITEEDAGTDPEMRKALDEIRKIEAERQSVYAGTWKPGQAQPTATTEPTTVLPLPGKKEDLVTGQVYQTARGPARWDGTKFVQ